MNLRQLMSLLLISQLTLSGCSIVRTHEQYVHVSTNRPEASIYVNGQYAGQGEGGAFVKRNKTAMVVATKEGSYRVVHYIPRKINKVGILDIIGGCLWLVPFVGLAAPGAYSMKERNIHLDIE